MTVQVSAAGVIELQGMCTSEDAEVLLRHLSTHSGALIDWRACESAHTAIIQVLMASGAKLLGPPIGPALRWIVPALTRATTP